MTIPRALRRIAIVSMYGAYLAGAVLQWRQTPDQPQANLILGVFLFAFALGAILFASTQYLRWSSAKDAALDERERATRDAVYGRAYSIMAWTSVLLLAWSYAWPLLQRPCPSGFDVNINVIFWGYVLLMSTLPASLLAWKDRAPQ